MWKYIFKIWKFKCDFFIIFWKPSPEKVSVVLWHTFRLMSDFIFKFYFATCVDTEGTGSLHKYCKVHYHTSCTYLYLPALVYSLGNTEEQYHKKSCRSCVPLSTNVWQNEWKGAGQQVINTFVAQTKYIQHTVCCVREYHWKSTSHFKHWSNVHHLRYSRSY